MLRRGRERSVEIGGRPYLQRLNLDPKVRAACTVSLKTSAE